MNTIQYRDVGRIFPEVRTIFQISPPPPPTPNLTGGNTHIDIIVLWRQAQVKITCSHFISSCLLSAHIFKYIIKIQMKTNFLMWEKRDCGFQNRTTNSPLFQEKYSKESNRVKWSWGILCCRCCFIFRLCSVTESKL